MSIFNMVYGGGAPVKKYKYMTLQIDESVSNPSDAVTYASEDAQAMGIGGTGWDQWFGYYPCLLDFSGNNEIKVKHSLEDNTVDWDKDENGNAISSKVSGSSGSRNAMIAFPRLGWYMSKSGNKITISLTDDPNAYDKGYHYLAHVNGLLDLNNLDLSSTINVEKSLVRDKLYLGAFIGTLSSGYLRSIATGNLPTTSKKRSEFRAAGEYYGTHGYSSHYSQIGFENWMLTRIMYLFKYKSLNGQTALGRGYCDKTGSGGSSVSTGLTRTHKKLCYGSTSTGTDATINRLVLFGLEDARGNVWERADGFNVVSGVGYINTNPNGWEDGISTGYYSIGTLPSASGDYITKIKGTTQGGFIPTTTGGSSSTYYCDGCWTNNNTGILTVGGLYHLEGLVGPFVTSTNPGSGTSNAYIGGRLMFL